MRENKIEFNEEKIKLLEYNNLEKIMIKNLMNKNSSEFNEQKLEAEMAIQLMELHNFDNFMTIGI